MRTHEFVQLFYFIYIHTYVRAGMLLYKDAREDDLH